MQPEKFGSDDTSFQVTSFYCFTSISEETISILLTDLLDIAIENKIKGSVLLAEEGVNGTICGDSKGIEKLLTKIQSLLGMELLEVKNSWNSRQAFRRFKARRKKEIVTMGVKDIDPAKVSGDYIEPSDWNECIDDPDTLVIDTRNEYEVAIGSFKGSLNPYTGTFREFPEWVEKVLRPLVAEKNPKKIAMFCTGGIRCEKATSYLKKQGFPKVHHLHGGILRYLEDVPVNQSRWDGECFVFDQRVALNHQLLPGQYCLCHACGMPVSQEDQKKPLYIKGIQCPACFDSYSEKDRARFAERQRQVDELSQRLPGNPLWPNS